MVNATERRVMEELLDELGLTQERLLGIRNLTPDQARSELQKAQLEAKHRYKRLVFELHPDRNQNDPAKCDRLKVLTRVHEMVQNLRIQVVPPPQFRVMHVHFYTDPRNTSTSTSTTYGW